ncbi:hypothetical protein E2C01_005062 [Portunus trituberculatus]|uniref:Uncharacterized protein n=1 Tax=Portunus trituberculatus TaxID=210409 RepID=A0A5B7CRM6_PORTR|nr:hypothetical protein [Portunus trituberculatus]
MLNTSWQKSIASCPPTPALTSTTTFLPSITSSGIRAENTCGYIGAVPQYNLARSHLVKQHHEGHLTVSHLYAGVTLPL